jgi:hypothetical protein
MSATGRGLRERLIDDSYLTPGWVTRSILTAARTDVYSGPSSKLEPRDWALPRGPGIWMEPCAGDGAIIRAVQTFFMDEWRDAHPGEAPATAGPNFAFGPGHWYANEKRAACRKALKKLPNVGVTIGDFLKFKPDNGFPVYDNGVPELDLLITNPPFSLAMEFILHARKIFPGTPLCFLLRLNFLESQKRASFFKTAMPDVYVLPKRPSFMGNGTDATGYGWFIWRPALEGPRRFGSVSVLDLPKGDL